MREESGNVSTSVTASSLLSRFWLNCVNSPLSS
jgi:hypothetical protein